MSVQFGRWNFGGQPPAPEWLEKVRAVLAPYGPDSNETYSKGGLTILYRAFHTSTESHREKQPHICLSGAILTWDGRLDNRAEMISELRNRVTVSSPDVEIVASAYDKWGANCFTKLIGDWALSIWEPINNSLILAKDPIGIRHLYYSVEPNQITWSTILDPLVLYASRTFDLNEEYIAGWLAHLPAAHLTPYAGIDAVPPSSFVFLQAGKHTFGKYWDFDPGKTIRYRSDSEYEEHFRAVFGQAIKRRLRSDRPILAELSGGMDSSSIVCMADSIMANCQTDCPRLDTISWFDSSNPNWDDPIYFSKVEEKRRRTGCHIDLSGYMQKEKVVFRSDRLAATPVSQHRLSSELFIRAAAYMKSEGHRVTLSGIGGEQPNGGCIPTPIPELQNLLVRARFASLVFQLNRWATKMGKARFPLLWEAVRGFLPSTMVGTLDYALPPAPWLYPSFVRRNHKAFYGWSSRVKVFGSLPSFQEHLSVLNGERRLRAYHSLTPELIEEERYPYLDRDLREFAYAIPREQLVRVGQRRSLMKRSLVGIVPDEILRRKQTSFFPSALPQIIPTEWRRLLETEQELACSLLGFVDSKSLGEILRSNRIQTDVPLESLKRTVTLECWVRHLRTRGILTKLTAEKLRDCRLQSSPRSTKSEFLSGEYESSSNF